MVIIYLNIFFHIIVCFDTKRLWSLVLLLGMKYTTETGSLLRNENFATHLFSCYCRNFFESVLCCCVFFSKLIDAINGTRTVAIEEKFTQLELGFGLVLQLFYGWGQFSSEELVLEPPEMTHYKNHSKVLDHIILKPLCVVFVNMCLS